MEFLKRLFHLIRNLSDDAAWQSVIDLIGHHQLYGLLMLIVFVETGVVVFPFLPGDSLLFATGAIAARGILSLPTIIGLLFLAAILGDNCNYWLGRKLGPAVFKKDDSKLLNKKHLMKAHAFYEKYGSKTIIMARFVPIIRTFAPFVAGVGRMNYAKFLTFSIVGGAAWVSICTVAGYMLGGLDFFKKHFELVVLIIIAISLVPVAIEFLRHRKHPVEAVAPGLSDEASV